MGWMGAVVVCRLFGVSEDWGFGSGFGWLMEFSIVGCFLGG